ncbi:hypothetical protein HPP92_003801 [Vanilla planifolia]|uniref:Uncharacterized protein n=1 Tax=Vanilla planifolia TaxID=51239 RepID=A0A835S2G4_VANPL|nr:hypothetical protein HPP92_003801 [Vanilla planifolia]
MEKKPLFKLMPGSCFPAAGNKKSDQALKKFILEQTVQRSEDTEGIHQTHRKPSACCLIEKSNSKAINQTQKIHEIIGKILHLCERNREGIGGDQLESDSRAKLIFRRERKVTNLVIAGLCLQKSPDFAWTRGVSVSSCSSQQS